MDFLARSGRNYECSYRKHGYKNAWNDIRYYIEQRFPFENKNESNFTEIFVVCIAGRGWTEYEIPFSVSLIVIMIDYRLTSFGRENNFTLIIIVRSEGKATVLPVKWK